MAGVDHLVPPGGGESDSGLGTFQAENVKVIEGEVIVPPPEYNDFLKRDGSGSVKRP